MQWLPSRPPAVFKAVSLSLIVVMVVATGYTQSRFFEDALIQREAVIVRDMVTALAYNSLRAADFEQFTKPESQLHFERSLSALKSVTGVVRIKVYNADNTIVWSDAQELVGRNLPKSEKHLAKVWAGVASSVFNPAKRPSHADEHLPGMALIEFYVPVAVKKVGTSGDEVLGAVAIYRLADDLTRTLRRGMLLVWLATAVGGALLFLALFRLFNAVYRRQRSVESQFANLSNEHERIVQMEKLSAMGRMVSEIAHQINNPLVGVINLAQRAQAQTDQQERVKALLGEIVRAGEQCRDFVQRMLRFTQLGRSEPQATRLGALLRDTIAFFAQSVGAAAPVSLAELTEDVVLQLDPVLMRHALFNLIHNASEANPAGPVEVSVAAQPYQDTAGWAIAVRDHGPGLTPEAMQHLFIPFYSTRPGGTGLGLSVAQHIVVQHGGVLRAKNHPDGGAQFVIWLPAQPQGVAHEAKNPAG